MDFFFELGSNYWEPLFTDSWHIPSSSCLFFDYTPAFFLQVIYKTFQIPCPFEEYSANSTAAHLTLNVSSHGHGHEYNNGVVHEHDDDQCYPRMFTINSQVGGRGEDTVCLAIILNIKATNAEVRRCALA